MVQISPHSSKVLSVFFTGFVASSISAVPARLKYTPRLTSGCAPRELFLQSNNGQRRSGRGRGNCKAQADQALQSPRSSQLLEENHASVPEEGKPLLSKWELQPAQGSAVTEGKLSRCARERRGTVLLQRLLTKLLQVFIVKQFFF